MRGGGTAQAIRSKYLSIDTFTPDNARKASPAAEGMCKWVHAMSAYDKARVSLQAVDAGGQHSTRSQCTCMPMLFQRRRHRLSAVPICLGAKKRTLGIFWYTAQGTEHGLIILSPPSCLHYPHVSTTLMSPPPSCLHHPHVSNTLMSPLPSCLLRGRSSRWSRRSGPRWPRQRRPSRWSWSACAPSRPSCRSGPAAAAAWQPPRHPRQAWSASDPARCSCRACCQARACPTLTLLSSTRPVKPSAVATRARQELVARLAGMEAELRGNTERRARLEADIALCSVKLVRAAERARGLVSSIRSARAWCSSRA